jgi:hypothetical protein
MTGDASDSDRRTVTKNWPFVGAVKGSVTVDRASP